MFKYRKIWRAKSVSLMMATIAICVMVMGQLPSKAAAEAGEIYKNPNVAVEARVNDLLSRMTLEEKIGQITQAERAAVSLEDISQYYLGSLLSGGGSVPTPNNVTAWADMLDGYQKAAMSTRLGIPLLYGADAVHGHNNLFGATIFPHNIALGATRDTKLVERIGAVTAEEMRATGVNWNFAPCLATPQNIRWGRTYEGFSENTQLVTDMGVAYIRGFQGKNLAELKRNNKVIATVKHYLGEGITEDGKNQGNVVMDPEKFRQVLQQDLLLPYKAGLEAGALTLMPSFNSVNGVKCTGNKELLTDIVKGQLEFDGFIITDWDAVYQLPGSKKEQIKAALLAGNDMFMVPWSWKEFIQNTKELVQDKEVPMARIDDAVRRILRVKIKGGLLERSALTDRSLAKTVGSAEHREIARKAVRESLVLLKNDEDIVGKLKNMNKIFVAGKNADDIGIQCGGWSLTWQGSEGNITTGTTILQGIKQVTGNAKQVTYSQDGTGAAGNDVAIVVIGEKPYTESAGDSENLILSDEDIAVLENVKQAGIPTVAVLVSGRPLIVTDYIRDWAGVVEAWLPGTEGEGVADVLFGNYDFQGKLPVSWPWYVEQLPVSGDNIKNYLFQYGYGLRKGQIKVLPVQPPNTQQKQVKVNSITGKIMALDYASQYQVSAVGAADGDSIQALGWINPGKWMTYCVDIPKKGNYVVNFRVANGNNSAANIALKSDRKILGTASIPPTGGWDDKYTTVSMKVELEAGKQMIKLVDTKGGFNFKWLEIISAN